MVCWLREALSRVNVSVHTTQEKEPAVHVISPWEIATAHTVAPYVIRMRNTQYVIRDNMCVASKAQVLEQH